MRRYALAAAARGWHVFPLTPYDKRPLPGFTAWEAHATTDPALIHRMWARGPYNIGIACGPSNLVVLDLDVPNPDEHPPAAWARPGINDGSDVLAALCEQAGQPLPLETFMVRTRRSGTHLYFTAPADLDLRNTAGKLGWKIDTRARGGYVVAPGSIVTLPDGTGSYDVLHDPAPAPLPPWLADRLTAQPPTTSAGAVLIPVAETGPPATPWPRCEARSNASWTPSPAPATPRSTWPPSPSASSSGPACSHAPPPRRACSMPPRPPVSASAKPSPPSAPDSTADYADPGGQPLDHRRGHPEHLQRRPTAH